MSSQRRLPDYVNLVNLISYKFSFFSAMSTPVKLDMCLHAVHRNTEILSDVNIFYSQKLLKINIYAQDKNGFGEF